MISLRINRTENSQMRQLWDNSDADVKDGIEGSEKTKRSSWTGIIITLIVIIGALASVIFFL